MTWHGGFVGVDRPLFGPITRWDLSGSEEIFCGLIQNDSNNVWELLLDSAMHHFNVSLLEDSSFLGAGRFGHVFHVINSLSENSSSMMKRVLMERIRDKLITSLE